MALPNEDAAESLSAFCVPDMKTLWKCSVITELCFEADK